MTPRTNSNSPEVLRHPAAMDQGEAQPKTGDQRDDTPVFSSQQHECCASDTDGEDKEIGQIPCDSADIVDEETFWSQAFGNGKDPEEPDLASSLKRSKRKPGKSRLGTALLLRASRARAATR